MTDPTGAELPDGVLVSTDAGTPSAFEGNRSPDDWTVGADATWDEALEALEFGAVLAVVAERAAGPLGRASVLARRPQLDPAAIRDELARVEELARLIRAARGVIAEA